VSLKVTHPNDVKGIVAVYPHSALGAKKRLRETIVASMRLNPQGTAFRTPRLITVIASTFAPQTRVEEVFEVVCRPDIQRAILGLRQNRTTVASERTHRVPQVPGTFIQWVSFVKLESIRRHELVSVVVVVLGLKMFRYVGQ
jgi:hypothetical protein